jgi:hypothetical protein
MIMDYRYQKWSKGLLFALFLAGTAYQQTSLATDASFSITATLLENISLTNTQGLDFGNLALTSSQTPVVIAPTDAGAAIFSAVGTSNDNAVGSVASSTATITCTTAGSCGNDTMSISSFTLGGDMDSAGATNFGSTGKLSNLRIGGTLTIDSTDQAGDYSGTTTFRLAYQ